MDDWGNTPSSNLFITLYVESEAKRIKDAAWVKDSGLLDDVQDNWDVESESDAEQVDVTKASLQKIGMRERSRDTG